MGIRHCATSILLMSAVLLINPFAFGDSIQVSIGTAALSGTSGTLAFDFIDGDGVVNNSISILSFASDATLEPGIPTGSVTGDLLGTLTLSDTNFFNELLVPATLGSSITFTVQFTNVASSPPDTFTFFLLDGAAINSLVATDLPGDALFEIQMIGSSTGPVLLPSAVTPAVTVSLGSGPPSEIPEPASLLLTVSGLSFISLLRPYWIRALLSA